jgi:lysophospholipid acyltransferase (LPLAT)-like uncharacterized protein
MKQFLIDRVLPHFLYGMVCLWCSTLRGRSKNPENEAYIRNLPGRYILTLWHGRIFYLFFHLRRHSDYHLLISPSKDGDWLARLARLMGYSVIRGSSYKQAISSARSLIKVLRNGERIIIVADGSRGPRLKAQAGSIQLAGMTQSPIIPMTYGSRKKHVFKSWDRFVLPFPFTRCTVNFGSPILVPSKLDGESLLLKQTELENSLNKLTEESESPN